MLLRLGKKVFSKLVERSLRMQVHLRQLYCTLVTRCKINSPAVPLADQSLQDHYTYFEQFGRNVCNLPNF